PVRSVELFVPVAYQAVQFAFLTRLRRRVIAGKVRGGQLRQNDGVKSAGYDENSFSPFGQFFLNGGRHGGFARECSIGVKFFIRGINPSEMAPGRDVVNELFHRAVRGGLLSDSSFKKMIPKIVVIAAAGAAGQGLQIAAAFKMM